MTKNDKGCCCLCPSYVGLTLLAIWDTIHIVIAILLLSIGLDDIPFEHWLLIQLTVFGAQIIQFIAVLIWRTSYQARLTLFILRVIAVSWSIAV